MSCQVWDNTPSVGEAPFLDSIWTALDEASFATWQQTVDLVLLTLHTVMHQGSYASQIMVGARVVVVTLVPVQYIMPVLLSLAKFRICDAICYHCAKVQYLRMFDLLGLLKLNCRQNTCAVYNTSNAESTVYK